MESQQIFQWDNLYPTKADFLDDIKGFKCHQLYNKIPELPILKPIIRGFFGDKNKKAAIMRLLKDMVEVTGFEPAASTSRT